MANDSLNIIFYLCPTLHEKELLLPVYDIKLIDQRQFQSITYHPKIIRGENYLNRHRSNRFSFFGHPFGFV